MLVMVRWCCSQPKPVNIFFLVGCNFSWGWGTNNPYGRPITKMMRTWEIYMPRPILVEKWFIFWFWRYLLVSTWFTSWKYSTIYPHSVQPLIHFKEEIGWDKLFRRQLSILWKDLHQHYLLHSYGHIFFTRNNSIGPLN